MKRFSWVVLGIVASVFIAQMGFAEKMTLELVKQKATEAAELFKKEGPAAFPKMKDPAGSFRYGDGEGYVWVHRLADSVMLMHPVKPSMENQSFADLKDSNGTPLFLAFNEAASSPNGAGWVAYLWPKPGEKTNSPKATYLIKVGEYVVGSGMYDATAADVKAKYPNDFIWGEKK